MVAVPRLNRWLLALNGLHFARRVAVGVVVVQTMNFEKFAVKGGYLVGFGQKSRNSRFSEKFPQILLYAALG